MPLAQSPSAVSDRRLLFDWRAWLLFGGALSVRLLAILVLGSADAARGLSAWDWGWEPGSMAASLATGGGFGSPFGVETGPSGWLTPIYPLVLAACMKLFGGVTPSTTWAVFGLHSIASATMCVLLVRLGRAIAHPRVGWAAGVLFAFYPASIWYAAGRVWDSTFVAFGLLAFIVLLLEQGDRPKRARTFGLGLVYACVLLVNPAPVGILPAVLLYMAGGRPREILARWARFIVATLLACSPWMLHNYVVLGSPGLRTNLGVELRVGNNPDADGRHQTQYHPADPRNTPRYVLLGEAEYAQEAKQRAVRWMWEHPAEFASLCLTRARLFWFGEDPRSDSRHSQGRVAANDPKAWIKWLATLAGGVGALTSILVVRPRGRRVLFLIGVLALFPIPYYITHVSERYRFPIDSLLAFFSVWLVLRLFKRADQEVEA